MSWNKPLLQLHGQERLPTIRHLGVLKNLMAFAVSLNTPIDQTSLKRKKKKTPVVIIEELTFIADCPVLF